MKDIDLFEIDLEKCKEFYKDFSKEDVIEDMFDKLHYLDRRLGSLLLILQSIVNDLKGDFYGD